MMTAMTIWCLALHTASSMFSEADTTMTTDISHDDGNGKMASCLAPSQQHVFRQGATIATTNLSCDDSNDNMLSTTTDHLFVVISRLSRGVQSISRL